MFFLVVLLKSVIQISVGDQVIKSIGHVTKLSNRENNDVQVGLPLGDG